ncbi:hypothetical protein PG999_001290 [Apiospora kogelbergensis]|uniref:Heterokaryon incompatibility domain-containing protein n=1 Tax=Apiospora kogelbergensis TaxID=1337665 RepID=A0AAW0RE80_9PEZI
MRSHARYSGNIYNGFQQPAYNTFSYTWGRFELIRERGSNDEERQVLPVSNITWPIPEIRPEIFTVEEFQNAIHKASADTEWLWLDVACIDQKDDLTRDDEIGRQAAIFNNAVNSFIWLHATPLDTLQHLVDLLFESVSYIDNNSEAKYAATYDVEDEELPSDTGRYEKCIEDSGWIAKVSETLSILESDPWFSSLWTLQEAYLRQAGIILSKEGCMPERLNYDVVGLASLLMAWGEIDRVIRAEANEIRRSTGSQASSLLLEADRLLERMERLGLEAGDNPIILYSAAGCRQTKYKEDRIYGIMQVFGFRLGKTTKPGTHYTLQELEKQFAIALHERSAVWAQLFVHTQPQLPGYHWCISQSSRLPACLALITMGTRSCSTIEISQGSTEAVFSGPACGFSDLKGAWDRTRADGCSTLNFWQTRDTEQGTIPIEVIVLDNSHFAARHVPSHLRTLEHHNELHPRNKSVGELLASDSGCTLKVFLLGQISSDADTSNIDEDEEMSIGGTEFLASVGILARLVQYDGGEERWQRIGITVWANIPGSAIEDVDWCKIDAILD